MSIWPPKPPCLVHLLSTTHKEGSFWTFALSASESRAHHNHHYGAPMSAPCLLQILHLRSITCTNIHRSITSIKNIHSRWNIEAQVIQERLRLQWFLSMSFVGLCTQSGCDPPTGSIKQSNWAKQSTGRCKLAGCGSAISHPRGDPTTGVVN